MIEPLFGLKWERVWWAVTGDVLLGCGSLADTTPAESFLRWFFDGSFFAYPAVQLTE